MCGSLVRLHGVCKYNPGLCLADCKVSATDVNIQVDLVVTVRFLVIR